MFLSWFTVAWHGQLTITIPLPLPFLILQEYRGKDFDPNGIFYLDS